MRTGSTPHSTIRFRRTVPCAASSATTRRISRRCSRSTSTASMAHRHWPTTSSASTRRCIRHITLSGTQRVFTTANQAVNISLNLDTGSNTITNAAYYAPSRDYTAEVVAMHQWSIWRSGEKSLVQRFYLTAGAYNERGFGTSSGLASNITGRSVTTSRSSMALVCSATRTTDRANFQSSLTPRSRFPSDLESERRRAM
ncbi:hypothetical protein [Paraburkholderia sp. J63]|uniref:hypothetical protein n=1 Tax=Paraburkholderia sp. J63 TaxID=2805434 RepID=UPI0039F4A1A2